MHRLRAALKVQPGEGRMAALLIGLMLVGAAGSSIGSASIDALFFARFGTGALPYMYVALGVVTFVNLMAVTALLGRVRRERLYVVLPLVLALFLVGERLLLALRLNWFYPVLWLGKDVLNALLGQFTWGLAGALCDTRQAKRLFPLFTAGSIFGAVVGASGTPLLVNALHSENMLLVWAGAFGITFALGWGLTRRAGAETPAQPHAPGRVSRQKPPSFVEEMQQGYRVVRKSPLLRWNAAAAVLFSVLWFSLLLPFSRAATEHYPNADALAGFFAAFQSVYTIAALLASLFLANRLFARFGIMPMLIVYPAIYLAGFSVLAVFPLFSVLVGVRFIQLIWSQGIADTVWQATFNVVPLERRDHARAFINGVPGQFGIILAGVILVIGEQALRPDQLYLVGLGAAALCVFVLWQAKRAYSAALVEALRAGRPQVFTERGEEEPFGGFQRDAAAVNVAVAGLADPEPAVRRVSAEVLGHLRAPEAVDALVGALRDADLEVRAASLRGLARAKADHVLPEVTTCLRDPEPDVREQAVSALSQLTDDPSILMLRVGPLLNDPDARVRARAAVALLRTGPYPEARDLLRQMVALGEVDERVNALDALGEMGDAEAFELVAMELGDAHTPAPVRRAAASALAGFGINMDRSIELLIGALADQDRSVRDAAAKAMGRFGQAALDRTVAALAQPESASGALSALEHLPAQQAASALRAFAHEQVSHALRYHDLFSQVDTKNGDDRAHLLAASLWDKAARHATRALRAIGLLGDRSAIALALDNLKGRTPAQRANALETLEAMSEAEIVRPLLKIWETAEVTQTSSDGLWLRVLQDEDAWLRACAACAADSVDDAQLRSTLTQLAQSDPDAVVRETAAAAVAMLTGEHAMDTLATLSLMERILFLRRVPLFADLPPSDLKQVAAIANETVCPDGETLAVQGEPGDEMYIIVSGEIRVLTAAGNGPEVEVARRKPGEYVGEMAIISQEPRMASLVAAGDARMLCIDQKSFEGLLRERPEISLAVMRVLCARLKEAPSAGRTTPPARTQPGSN